MGFSRDAEPGPGRERTVCGSAQRSKDRVCSEGRSFSCVGKGRGDASRTVWVRIQVSGPSQGAAVDKFLFLQGDAYLSTDQ